MFALEAGPHHAGIDDLAGHLRSHRLGQRVHFVN